MFHSFTFFDTNTGNTPTFSRNYMQFLATRGPQKQSRWPSWNFVEFSHLTSFLQSGKCGKDPLGVIFRLLQDGNLPVGNGAITDMGPYLQLVGAHFVGCDFRLLAGPLRQRPWACCQWWQHTGSRTPPALSNKRNKQTKSITGLQSAS